MELNKISLRAKLRDAQRNLKRELATYRLLAKDSRTPRAAKRLLGFALGYALLPFDLIPDFLPLIGHLDDAIIVPGLIVLALRSVPPELLAECRAQAQLQIKSESTPDANAS